MKHISQILALGLIAGVSAFAATFNAYNEFGGTNPTGVWSYGSANPANPGVFTPFAPGDFNGSCASGLACWTGPTGASVVRPNSTFSIGTVLLQLNFLTLHPASDGTVAVLRFTAPTADDYTFNASFIDQDVSGGNGVVLLYGFGTTPAPTVGSEVVGANFLATPRSLNQTVTLASGASAYFGVGNNGSFEFDSVGLSLVVTSKAPIPPTGNVPEPSTFLLTTCGAALAFFLRRRRA